jgi:CDP-6-deoxy-D-xylo-4-hexulose-3-dehydrase
MNIRVRVGEFRVDNEIRNAVERVLCSGRVSEGKETREFEASFARYIGTRHAVAVNSGTSALIAGLTAFNARAKGKPRKKNGVITSPLTYVATANSIVLADMEPIFVDVDPDTFTMLPGEAEDALGKDDSEGIGMILPVHLMGYVCDMDHLKRLASDHGLILFEDSSQAHGSIYKGRRAGSLADASAFSFYIAHNIQAGELGALLTNDREIARLVRKIKANGRLCDCLICTRPQGKCPKFRKGKDEWDPRFMHDMIGYNFKTMEFPTAIAAAQIARADEIAGKRRKNVKTLNDLLSAHADVLKLPVYSDNVSYLGYPLVIRDPKKLNREQLQLSLESNGVETRPLFGCIPIHQPAYAHLRKKYKGKLPNAEYLGAHGFYIGCHQYLTEDDLEFVKEAFGRSLRETVK